MPPTAYSVVRYINDLRDIRATGSATAETSYYPPLERLLNAAGRVLVPQVLFSTQLRNQGAGMPDGGLFPQPRTTRRDLTPPTLQNPERGVVEIKPAGYDLDVLSSSPQLAGYLRQYGLVLITNLHEFRLLEHNPLGHAFTRECYIVCSERELWSVSATVIGTKHAQLLPDFLKRVMLYRAPLVQPKDVASLLASYAREAKSRAEDHPLAGFDLVKQTLQDALGIQFEGEKGERFFRSTLIQTLFYGIFSAWVLWHRSDEGRSQGAHFDWRISAHYLRVPVLRRLFGEVAEPGALNSIHLIEVLHLAGEALNRVLPGFFDTFTEQEAVAYFYEPFLEAFDPQLRKDLGVWYTPKEIVNYMVSRVDHVLRTQLSQPLGLASPAVRILDPCCGTGAYLTAILEHIHQTLLSEAGDDAWQVPNQLREVALTRLFGFEIMPAPFVIAHLQIATLLEKAGAALADSDRARIYLTNALTGWVPETHPQTVLSEEFRREREASEHVKQQGTILVIIGNPPYNGYAGLAKMEEEQDLPTCYKQPVVGIPPPEGKGLNDLYVRFFRVAERRIIGSRLVPGNNPQQGVVCLISNSSWLDGFSHPTMRSHFLSQFNSVQIDNLNGDKFRTGKTCPDGTEDPSVFSTETNREGIQPGVAIATFTKTGPGHALEVSLRSLWGRSKLQQLQREADGALETQYVPVEPEPILGLPFAQLTYTQEYLSWPLLSRLFQSNYNGVQTSRDNLLVDIDRDRLEQRVQQYFALDLTDAALDLLIPGIMKPGDRYESREIRAYLKEKGYRPWQIRTYMYRPFDVRFVYWESETKLLNEKREEYIGGHFGNISLVLPKQNRGGYAGPFVASSVVDLNCVDGGASTYAETFLTSTPLEGTITQNNWSDDIEQWRRNVGLSSSELMFHILAITHSPQYHEENIGALQRDWPRIPLPASSPLLRRSSQLGSRLCDLLNAEQNVAFSAEWTFISALKLSAPHDLKRSLLLSADWGRLQGAKVMPGNGKSKERPWSPKDTDRLTRLASSTGLEMDSVFALLGDECIDVYLNDSAFWSAIPTKVWDYSLGGYQVLKKWLSYRGDGVIGRSLRPDEAAYFSQVARRITAILLMGEELNENYGLIVASLGRP